MHQRGPEAVLRRVIERPRHVGVVVAAVLLFWGLSSGGLTGGRTVLVVWAWLIGLGLGGHYPALLAALQGPVPATHGYDKSWSGLLVSGSILALIAALAAGSTTDLVAVANTLSLATAVLYGFAKVGCWRFGCCGWTRLGQPFPGLVPLQVIEAASSFGTAGALALLIHHGPPLGAAAAFLTIHGLQRFLSRFLRSGRVAGAFWRLDSGLAIALGYFLVLLPGPDP
jgi:hypothetical protein